MEIVPARSPAVPPAPKNATPIAAPIHRARRAPLAQRAGVPHALLADDDLNVFEIWFDDGGAELFDWSGLLEPEQGFMKVPRLQEMRALGVTFTRAYSPTICGPARIAAEFGQYGFRTGGGANYDGAGAPGFSAGKYGEVQTLLSLPRAIDLARNEEYVTCWTGKGHLMADVGRETFPIELGWDRYVGCQSNSQSFEHWPVGQVDPTPIGDPSYVPSAGNSGHFHFREIEHDAGWPYASRVYGEPGTWPAGGPYVAWDDTCEPPAAWDAYKATRDALEFANAAEKPFVIKLCLNPPHGPFEVPPFDAPDTNGGTFRLVSPETEAMLRSFGRGTATPGFRPTSAAQRRAVFNANGEAVDSLIGWLFDRLDPAKRAKTVFIFWGDNGTVANVVGLPYNGGHGKRSPYEQGIRVPAIIWSEHAVIADKGRSCDHLAHIVDLYPTILDLVGCDPELWNPDGTIKVDGRSLLPILANAEAEPARDFIYTEVFEPLGARYPGDPTGTPPIPAIDPTLWLRAYSDGTHKLIAYPQGSPIAFRLFNITNDLQPASGEPGYLERDVDDLYLHATGGLDPDLALVLSELQSAMLDLIES